MGILGALILALVLPLALMVGLAAWIVQPPRPKRETYDQMQVRSAHMDHELWPTERQWPDHPSGCRHCRFKPTTIAELNTQTPRRPDASTRTLR